MKTPAQKLANYLQQHQLTIAFAESVTCGLASHTIGNVSGTSDFFKGCIVCYDESVKLDLFEIKPTILKKYTAESQEVTDLLAKKLKLLIQADIHAGITGLASAGGSESAAKPVGTVFFSVIFKRKLYRKRHVFTGMPLEVKKKACRALFEFVLDSLQ